MKGIAVSATTPKPFASTCPFAKLLIMANPDFITEVTLPGTPSEQYVFT